jgi:ribosomal protein S12 methylthiotransferase accessory factor
MRAIVPGLQPLGFGPGLRLGGRRLYDAPLRMGVFSSRPAEQDLNRVPHCFP